jgi:hypothetical protein
MVKYCLVFEGEIDNSFQLDKVKLNFKHHFKLTEIQIKYIFSGKEITLKKGLSQKDALNFAMRIDEMGGVSYIEPMPPEVNLPKDIIHDRRIVGRRHHTDRRDHARAGISADRRIKSDRRKSEE